MIFLTHHAETGNIHLAITGFSIESFKTILSRALNNWPECPAEWKELADKIIHGEVLQDYASQNQKMSATGDHTVGTKEEIDRIYALMNKYGTYEYRQYQITNPRISLDAWETKMKEKYPSR